MFGMIINGVLTLAFVPLLGVQGAGIGSAIGFFIVLMMRIRNTRSIVEITVDWKKLGMGLILFGIQAVSLWVLPEKYQLSTCVVILLLVIGLNINLIGTLKGKRKYV